MPGRRPRNAKLSVAMMTSPEAARWGHNLTRLSLKKMEGHQHMDFVSVLADDVQGHDAVLAIVERKYATHAQTLARRREVVERAKEAAAVLGWEPTEDELAMLAAF